MMTAPAPNAKITVYMPPDMVADLDWMRSEMVRSGRGLDRGRMVRSAIRVAAEHPDEWRAEMAAEGA